MPEMIINSLYKCKDFSRAVTCGKVHVGQPCEYMQKLKTHTLPFAMDHFQ